jgi:hypothetical protein
MLGVGNGIWPAQTERCGRSQPLPRPVKIFGKVPDIPTPSEERSRYQRTGRSYRSRGNRSDSRWSAAEKAGVHMRSAGHAAVGSIDIPVPELRAKNNRDNDREHQNKDKDASAEWRHAVTFIPAEFKSTDTAAGV